MPQIKLIHKSRKYADDILSKIEEDRIRDIILQCWSDAYTAGYEAAIKNYGNIREDMGR